MKVKPNPELIQSLNYILLSAEIFLPKIISEEVDLDEQTYKDWVKSVNSIITKLLVWKKTVDAYLESLNST